VKIAGHTKSDEEIPERGDQIADFLVRAGSPPYVVIDDGSEEPPVAGALCTMTASLVGRHAARWVKVDGAVGLTDADVERAAAVLKRSL
jgi:hypothetical protein